MREMLYIIYYLWYIIEWIILLFKYGSKAYRNIRFEKEAYANEDYKLQVKFNKFTAEKIGKVDKFYSYTPQDIDLNFRKENENYVIK